MPDVIFNMLDGDIKSKLEKKTKRKSNKLYEADEQDALVELLEDFGFTNVAFKWNSSPYNFDCDQVGGGVACPCCNGVHDNNNYFYRIVDDMEIHVKNHSESCEAKVMNSYKVVKYLFERKVCRINDTMDYVFEDEKPDENPFQRPEDVRPAERLITYEYNKFKQRFANLRYTDEEDKKRKFIFTWLEDTHMRQYAMRDFYPENCPERVFNTWRGYAVENIDPALGAKGSSDKFVELLNVLTDGQPKYALDYYALLFQQPGTKPRTCLVYRGKPGCGKGVHLTSLEILMGSDLYFETNKAQQDVFGNHATAFDCNKLVAMNESSMKYNAENKQILLSLITDTKGVLINQKNVQSYKVRNLAGTIMMSNDEVVVYVDEDDRRFVVFETGQKYRNDQAYFTEYEKYMLKPENQRAIYDFLMKRDISQVDWVNDRPKTKAYIKMRNSSLSPCLKWFVDFIDNYPFEYNDMNHGWVSRGNIHKWRGDELCYKYPAPKDKDPKLTFGKDMTRMLEKYEVPSDCVKKEKFNGVMWWTIDHQKSKKWLEDKEFLMKEDAGG